MMITRKSLALFVGLAVVCAAWAAVAKPVLVFNEDDSHFFGNPGHASEAALNEYVDMIAAGGQVTHFFMCPNAMRANFDSKVFEPAWAPCAVPGWEQTSWSRTLKTLHEKGIDPYRVWAKRCREKGISPWLSMRMNDVHFVTDPAYGGHSKFWREHPQFWRVPNAKGGGWGCRALDFAHPEVRAYALAFIDELLERYDVDGLECDWMRFPDHLTEGRERELSGCLDAFMAEVRKRTDAAAARRGHPVRVAARVDSDPEAALARGTDAFAWAKAGSVDWIIPCNFFSSVDFELPFADWKRRMAAANPSVRVLPGLDAGVVIKGVKGRRLLTVPEYRGWAHRIYGQGADGIYLFNLFTHGDRSPVMKTILAEGLAPENVAAQERSVPTNAVRECLGIIRARRPLAGVIRWDCWAGKDGVRGGEQTRVLEKTLAPEKYRWRLPWFAEVKADGSVSIDGAKPGVMEREIDYAADAGLDYFIFLNYGINSHKTDALDRFRSAKNSSRMKYAICFMFYKVDIPDEIWPATVAKYMDCLEDKNYVRVRGGRPLVYTMHIGEEALNARVSELKSAAAARGLNPYFVYLNNTPDEMWPKMKELGYDAYGMYATAKGLAAGPCAYGDFATNMEDRVQGVALRKGHPCVPCCQTGWQKDPRKDHVPYWEKGLAYHSQPGFPAVATPDEIADSIQRVRNFVQTHPGTCPANTFTVYAWNEHDEGGWLCPTWTPSGVPDTSRVDALKKINRALSK